MCIVHFSVPLHTSNTFGWAIHQGTCELGYEGIQCYSNVLDFRMGIQFLVHRYFGVAFGLANTWVWLSSNSTVHTKVQLLVERIVGKSFKQLPLLEP